MTVSFLTHNLSHRFYRFEHIFKEAAKPVWERQTVQADPVKEDKEEDGKDKKKKKKKKKSDNWFYLTHSAF